MPRGIKRKRAKSGPPPSSLTECRPSSSSKFYAKSVSPSRNADIKSKKAKNHNNLTLEELFEDVTMKDSDEGFLPTDLTPFEVTSDDEREDNMFDDDDGKKDTLMPPSEEDLPHPNWDSSNGNEEEGGEYEVERILLKPKGSDVYFVKWLGYNLNRATYEDTWNLARCTEVIKAFEERQKLCHEIYKSLPNKDEYKGYFDTWINGINTPAFIEACMLEDIFTKFCNQNKFGPLYVENWARMVETYPNFVVIAENIFSAQADYVLQKAGAAKVLCKCDGVCGVKSQDCPCMKFCATSNGFLRFKQYTYLSECHKDCQCSEKCRGKIFKRGRKIPVMLFKTPYCGWGLRTCVFIPNNKFVMEYVGHIKLHVECRDIKDETYLFNIDTDNAEPIFVIDATDYGNSSRFINHSCDPNLEVVLVKGYFNGHFYSRVTFFSIREIQAGEELTFNYFKHDVDLSKINPKLSPPPECFCGYEKCRKYLI